MNIIEIHKTCDVILARWLMSVNRKLCYANKHSLKMVTSLVLLLLLYNCAMKWRFNRVTFSKNWDWLLLNIELCKQHRLQFLYFERMRTYLRNATKMTRLNGLAHLNIFRYITLKIDQMFHVLLFENRFHSEAFSIHIIGRFFRKKIPRIELLICMNDLCESQ